MRPNIQRRFSVNAAELVARREAAGLSQFGLATELGLDRSSITTIENDGHIPRQRTQRALAVRLGLPVTELFPQVEPSRSILEGMRDERRLTVAEACAEIDITPRVLMKAEAGQPVALNVRRKISTFYEVPIAYWYKPQKLDAEVAA